MSAFEDVVVVIPGISGSVLEKDGGDRWALSGSAIARFLKSFGNSLWDLTLTDDDPSQFHAADGVRATALLDDLHLVPGLWRIDGYSQIPRRLRRFNLVEGENLRLFPYDWRRDNRAAARRLHAESQVWLSEQRARGAADPKLVFICHSMGGLVARYFLEALGGWQQTRRLLTFGTPYRGSLDALASLCNGVDKPLIGNRMTDLLRSFPSVHQLLPVYPCIDDGSGTYARPHERAGGLPGVDPAMVADAAAFHREIADQQAANVRQAAYHEQGYTIHPIVGIAQKTLQSAVTVEGGSSFDMLESHGGRDLQGDGTVPYVSAFPAEWDDATDGAFVATKHSSMHNRPDGLAQLEGVMRGSAVDLGAFRSAFDEWVALDNDDLYATGDVVVTVRTSDTAPNVSLEPHRSEPDLASIDGEVTAAGDGYQVVFRSVPAGAWNLTAETDTARAIDSLVVMDTTG